MKTAIYKYVIDPNTSGYLENLICYQELDLPKAAKILCVQAQRDDLCLWAMVDVEQGELEKRKIGVHGTGHILVENIKCYLGTVQLQGLVLHVFELN